MSVVLDEVLRYLQDQLDWRTSDGKPMAVLTLNRAQAEFVARALRQGRAHALDRAGAGEDSPLPEASPRGP